MIKIIKNSDINKNLNFKYIKHRKLISRIILPITRWLRARNTEKYLKRGVSILDVGCGDGYFLRRCEGKFKQRHGLDLMLGDKIEKKLDYPDNSLDTVTMLAVIEHLDYPKDIITEISRILKPNGSFIFTTPNHKAEKFINLYAKDIKEEHKQYFTKENINQYLNDRLKLVNYNTFEFGLNQCFHIKKI